MRRMVRGQVISPPRCGPDDRPVHTKVAARRPPTRSGRGPAPELVAPASVSAVRCYARERVPHLSERRALPVRRPSANRPRRWPCPRCGPCVARSTRSSRPTGTALADANPWSTPFSRWGVHRAWWDAYGANAHEETVVVIPADARPDARPVGIVPLMHRHEVEPGDIQLRTTIRHQDGPALTAVPPDAKAVFFGASYHADYATLLAAPEDQPAVADALADYLAHGGDPSHPHPWDAVDLRRLRCGDPAADALASAFGRREAACGWTINVEQEDVCPVVTLPGRRDDRRLPGHPGQEGAPRDPAQGPPGRGRGRGPPRRLDRPDRRPARLHRPPPAPLGRRTACSPTTRAATRAAAS